MSKREHFEGCACGECKRVYGNNNWGEATPEDKERCIREVWPADGIGSPYQCLRYRGYGKNKEYCKQHAKMRGDRL